jgi:hypothetical protein
MSQKLQVSWQCSLQSPRFRKDPDDYLASLRLPVVVGTTQTVLWTPLWAKFTRTNVQTPDPEQRGAEQSS